MIKQFTEESALLLINKKCQELNYTILNFNYKNQLSKITLQCNIHTEFIWNPTFHRFIKQNSKCLKCINKYKKTESEIILDIKNKCKKLNYTFINFELNTFKNVKQKIILKCNIDNYEWKPTIDNFLTKESKCPKCMKNARLTEIDFKNNILIRTKINNHTFKTIVNKFKHGLTSFELQCNICQDIWKTTYNSYMAHNTSKCRKCMNLKKLTQNEAINKIEEKCKLRNYKFIKFIDNKYINNHSKIKILCNKHNHEWNLEYYNFVNSNNGCPICKESKGELLIRNFLNDNNIKFISQYKFKDCKNINKLAYDFYLTDYNICIEFDGRQHFNAYSYFGGEDAFKQIQLRDKIKNEYCKLNNIRLIRISYKENIIKILKNIII